MMQVEDKFCSFNVIFYFEIILIKSLSTVRACVRSVKPVRVVQSSRAGHRRVNGVSGVKRTSGMMH